MRKILSDLFLVRAFAQGGEFARESREGKTTMYLRINHPAESVGRDGKLLNTLRVRSRSEDARDRRNPALSRGALFAARFFQLCAGFAQGYYVTVTC